MKCCEQSLDDCLFGAVTVGERGQIVIPAEARKRYSIQPGDKLLVLAHLGGQGLMLTKMDEIREYISAFMDQLTKVEKQIEGTSSK